MPIHLQLLDDIELHFLHYADEEEATQKWERRLKRMHWDNLYFKFNDNDACTYELMKEFEELPYKSKVIFSLQRIIVTYLHWSTLNQLKSKDMLESI